MHFSTITFDITSAADGEYDVSYGYEQLPAICKYGKMNLGLL